MIDATVICATKRSLANGTSINHSPINGALRQSPLPGTTPISELFTTERGLRLKQADFFITDLTRRHKEGALPFLKKVALISGYVVPREHSEAVLLLGAGEGNAQTRAELGRRLRYAKMAPDKNVPILTWYKERRATWAAHSRTPKAPLVFNYFLRGRPRHILNLDDRIYSDNFYGLTPAGRACAKAWLAALNSTASSIGILREARNQGAGLAKLQLFEYRRAQVIDISGWTDVQLRQMVQLGDALISRQHPAVSVIRAIDEIVARVLKASCLEPWRIAATLAEVDRLARKPKL